MSDFPSVDLLNANHAFPCNYTMKVIGYARDGFVARIVSIVREELEQEVDPQFRLKETANGKYLSITLEPKVEGPEQILALYSRISQTDDVVMMM